MLATNTYGGGIDQTAVIGHAPEDRTWTPDQPTYAPVIHPTARIEAYATIDAGMVRNTTIGARTWVMKHVHVGHDVLIGEDCELSPGCVIGGHVTIGNGVRVGMGAVVTPYVTIGDGAKVGAGALISHDVPAGEFWAVKTAGRVLVPKTEKPKAKTVCSKCGHDIGTHAMGDAYVPGTSWARCEGYFTSTAA